MGAATGSTRRSGARVPARPALLRRPPARGRLPLVAHGASRTVLLPTPLVLDRDRHRHRPPSKVTDQIGLFLWPYTSGSRSAGPHGHCLGVLLSVNCGSASTRTAGS